MLQRAEALRSRLASLLQWGPKAGATARSRPTYHTAIPEPYGSTAIGVALRKEKHDTYAG